MIMSKNDDKCFWRKKNLNKEQKQRTFSKEQTLILYFCNKTRESEEEYSVSVRKVYIDIPYTVSRI